MREKKVKILDIFMKKKGLFENLPFGSLRNYKLQFSQKTSKIVKNFPHICVKVNQKT